MIRCDDVLANLHAYVDGELAAPNAIEVEAHLLDCADCRAAYESLRAVVDTVRGARPMYEPSPAFSSQLAAIVERRKWRVRFIPAAVAALAVLGLVGFWSLPSGPSMFVASAATTHLRYEQGMLPLDIQSSNAATVAGWLNQRLPFQVSLPPASAGEADYELLGARLVDPDSAYLVYRVAGETVSLLISSSKRVGPGGGKVVRSGKLDFHFSSEKGLGLIAWRDKDLTYALVSEAAGRSVEACVICHAASEERAKFTNLNPPIH